MNKSAAQKLFIPYVGEPLNSDNQDVCLKIRQNGVITLIDKINWSDYPNKPSVMLYAGYSATYLWLLYEVKGDFFRAKALVDQEAVWKDACVEFFISERVESINDSQSVEEVIYRNFEFNALGVCLSARGTTKQRKFLSPDEMKQILRFPGLTKQNMPEEDAEFDWDLCVAIPLNLLGLQPGSTFKANFYKCGDLTLHPHFISRSSIKSLSPNFHLPQFFGETELVS